MTTVRQTIPCPIACPCPTIADTTGSDNWTTSAQEISSAVLVVALNTRLSVIHSHGYMSIFEV
jgi:hypothetical protein